MQKVEWISCCGLLGPCLLEVGRFSDCWGRSWSCDITVLTVQLAAAACLPGSRS